MKIGVLFFLPALFFSYACEKTQADPAPQNKVQTTDFVSDVERIARVTGERLQGEKFVSPNRTATDWNVGGTDLGIIWEIKPGTYGLFFGDTYGNDFRPNQQNPGPNGSTWRSNVLALSNDNVLDDGLEIHSMIQDSLGQAKEIIPSDKDSSGKGNWTSIPTSAVSINGVQYVHYFNMRDWNGWQLNYSGIYKSVDDGLHWQECNLRFASNSYFAQVGYCKKDGYVYIIGTPSGRSGNARLARVQESKFEDLSAYEYWNGKAQKWDGESEKNATPLFEDKVGELSLIYNVTHKRWILAYFNQDRYNITLRHAEHITGPWSSPIELVNGKEYPQLYGSFFHPLSSHGDNLYFTMSMWFPYNVFLMKVTLSNN